MVFINMLKNNIYLPFGFVIFKQEKDVISKENIWVCFHKEYMYVGDTLFKLLKQIIFEYKYDRHLIG